MRENPVEKVLWRTGAFPSRHDGGMNRRNSPIHPSAGVPGKKND